MNRPRMAGIILGGASSVLGLYGLVHTKPLPLSARLGALSEIDTNRDGRISTAEWAKAKRPNAEMATLDTDHNGFIEPIEARSRRAPTKGH